MKQRLRAFVEGRVQGVAFRWFVDRESSRLGLGGWVRNRADGRVEVLAEGDRGTLEQLLACLGRGPRLARVDRIDVLWEDPTGEFTEFRIERSE